jgi:hypothetical protein
MRDRRVEVDRALTRRAETRHPLPRAGEGTTAGIATGGGPGSRDPSAEADGRAGVRARARSRYSSLFPLPSSLWRRQAARTLALAALALAAAGCAEGELPLLGAVPIVTGTLPDLSGVWAYEAKELQVGGRSAGRGCTIDGMLLHLGPWRATGFYGRTEGGVLACEGDLAVLGGVLPSYPVRRGGMVDDEIAFDIGTSDWRHEGRIAGDTMSGTLVLRSGSLEMSGRFRAVRRKP